MPEGKLQSLRRLHGKEKMFRVPKTRRKSLTRNARGENYENIIKIYKKNTCSQFATSAGVPKYRTYAKAYT